jgi:hypothetical protein
MSPRLPLVVVAVLALAACALPNIAAPGGGTPAGGGGTPPASLAQLGEPTPEDTGAHYRRDDWGDWAYDSATKCSTRERVLARDGRDLTVDGQCRPTCPTGDCWTSPYDGLVVGDAADLQIDHVVPLAEANRSGARRWTQTERATFYNDTDNLLAVSSRANQGKSDDDPAKWRPIREFWCDYATRYVAIKAKYKLTVDSAEHAELGRMLGTCAG